MQMLTIDASKCNGGGMCVQLSAGALVQKEKGTVPVAKLPDLCIDCGHCVAERPTDAIAVYRMDMDNSPMLREAAKREPDALLDFLRMRDRLSATRGKRSANTLWKARLRRRVMPRQSRTRRACAA